VITVLGGGENVTSTETFGEFATEDDSPTIEPVIGDEKMAGKDPDELGARTTFS
jgi:hypothetical protein